ncbi:MAG TPA: hypothetical protein VN256_25065 [Pyrinomonadaceae bacterium]|nr:hypothetical protein [Pyrinomonadaceae bacterium]
MRSRIVIPREVLLVEIERRCRDAACNARNRVGLTKEEARAYCGFECERCGREWDDVLAERDAPDWWEELAVTGLHALRGKAERGGQAEASEVVERLSEDYRRARGSAEGTREESS